MSRRYFGTDGVRGAFGGPLVNEEFFARLAFAAGRWSGGDGVALIGRDTRASGEALALAAARGLRAAGLRPVLLGVVPTPLVARAVQAQSATLGVVITASHNPAADNGIKFFGRHGIKLTDVDELAVEQLVPPAVPVAAEQAVPTVEALSDYIAAISGLLPAAALRGWRIALDTANGATCGTSPKVLRNLGAEVIALGGAPDGKNINAGVGSEYPALLAAKVRETGARLGIAHDGDGDRCVLCDENGSVLDGDEVLTLLGLYALKCGRLARQTLVITVQSNLGVDAALTAQGGRVCRTSVGDRYVIERMRAEGAMLGGESSGHIVCAEISPTGDGLVAAVKVLEVMLTTGKPLSALRRALVKFPQRTRALVVREKLPIETLPTLKTTIADMERELGTRGRVLVRYSGTETKLRLLIEGPDEATVQTGLVRLDAAARQDLVVLPAPA
ncbi:MAG: phosphoglucosamine mutase [Opitutae bacterium]|nr:phosphoglucosamine mutase [Opitutae bacterium]